MLINNNNNNNKIQKRTSHPEDFAVLESHSLKIKESKKIAKYLDLARELKKLLNMGNIVILIGTVLKGLKRGQKKFESRLHHYRDWTEESWRLEETSNESPPVKADEENYNNDNNDNKNNCMDVLNYK